MEGELSRRKDASRKTGRRDTARPHKTMAPPRPRRGAEPATEDRRVHPRIPVSWPVRLWVDGTAVTGRTIDVSEQGLCIVLSGATATLRTGETYRIDVIMGPKHEVKVTAEVRYVVDPVVGLRTKERLKLV
jgi:hypothetical protein